MRVVAKWLPCRTALMNEEQEGRQCGEVNDGLLNAPTPLSPLWATPIICWKLSSRYPAWTIHHFHKAVLTFTFSQPNPFCVLHHWLPLSAHSVLQRNFFPLNIFQAAACLSVGVCVRVFTHELMYGFYWSVKAAGMLTCVRYDMSCAP